MKLHVVVAILAFSVPVVSNSQPEEGIVGPKVCDGPHACASYLEHSNPKWNFYTALDFARYISMHGEADGRMQDCAYKMAREGGLSGDMVSVWGSGKALCEESWSKDLTNPKEEITHREHLHEFKYQYSIEGEHSHIEVAE